MEVLWTSDLNSQVYQDALSIRKNVFIEEQNVDKTIELDGRDHKGVHFVGYLDGKAMATARLIEEKPKVHTLQRVATLSTYRGSGYGALILSAVENYVVDNEGIQIILDAQDSAIKFYERNHYEVEGNGYIKANIPHHSMSKSFIN